MSTQANTEGNAADKVSAYGWKALAGSTIGYAMDGFDLLILGFMLSAISSGNCLIVAPVAEDLKVLNLAWDCGTEKLLEEAERKYVVRPAGNATTEMMATLLYLLKNKPDFKTVAIVNQDYSWGRDSRDILVDALKVLKPDARIVAEMFPKFGASDFSTEISRLQALRPDVIISTSWGGDLDTLVRQAAQDEGLAQVFIDAGTGII